MIPTICFLALTVVALFTLPTIAILKKLYNDRLDLTDGVRLIQDCYVHLVQAHFEILEPQNQSYDQSYEIAPFDFPIVLNRYDFKIQEYPDWSKWNETNGIKPCMRLNANLTENSWHNFAESVPEQKRSQPCTVILYVDPPICDGPPIPVAPPGFTFTLHNELNFYRGNKYKKTFGVNEFIVLVGRPQYRWTYEVFEYWYSAFDYDHDDKSYPLMIQLRLQKVNGKTDLMNSARLATCPNHEAYHRLATRKCSMYFHSQYFGTSSSGLEYKCLAKFQNYLDIDEIGFDVNDVELWRDFIAIQGTAPCEHRTLLLYAKDVNDLPRKTSRGEYLQSWMDRVGSVAHIFLRIFLHNSTYINKDDTWSPGFRSGYNNFYGFGVRKGYWLEIRDLTVKTIAVSTDVIYESGIVSELFYHSTKNDQVQFVMCSYESESEGLSLLGFVSAFRYEVWAVLVATVILGALLFQKVVNQVSSLSFTQHYKVIEEIWSILLAQGTRRLTTNKWFYGSWALAGLVLTNAYLGDNINSLTAPIPVLKWDTFPQILNKSLTVHSPRVGLARAMFLIDSYNWFTSYALSHNADQNDTKETQDDFQHTLEYEAVGNFTVFGDLFNKKHFNQSYTTVVTRLSLIESNQSSILESIKPGHFLSIVSRCASEPYVDVWSNVLKIKLGLLQKIANGSVVANPENVVVSKEPYGSTYNNMEINYIRINPSKLLRRFHFFTQSGIDQLWLSWQGRIDSWNDTVHLARNSDLDEFKPAKIGGNIRVVFYVHLTLVTIGIIAFLVEIFKRTGLTVRDIYMCIREFFETLYSGFIRIKSSINSYTFHRSKRLTVKIVKRDQQKQAVIFVRVMPKNE